jgi:esterase/lipase superfamily enzyme
LRLHSFQNDGVKVGSDGTIHNAKAIVEKIGPLCDYIMFEGNACPRITPHRPCPAHAQTTGSVPHRSSHASPGAFSLKISDQGDVAVERERVACGCADHLPVKRGELVFGVAWVSIPDRHRMAKIERPKWWKFEFGDAPNRFVTVMNADTLSQDAFEQQVYRSLKDSYESDILLFIHGYNVTFTQALRRTAQLAYDLNFSGTPILYSWPSQGTALGYLIDETNITWTEPHLQAVLSIVRSKVEARNVNVVAHSMGNRALIHCLASNRGNPVDRGATFRHIVLAAPDIDAAVFRNLATHIVQEKESRMTLYASSRDRALQLSRRVHGYPRAGDSGDALVVLPDLLDTIDATAVSTSLLGHSYYGDDRSIVSDIYALFRDGALPPRFCRRES